MTPSETKPDVAKIAAGLTEAQRRELAARDWWRGPRPPWVPGYPFGDYIEPVSPGAAASLYHKGLLDREEAMETDRYRGSGHTNRKRYFLVYRGTPLGLAVRDYLKGKG